MKQMQKDKPIGKNFWIALLVAVVLAAGLLGVLLPERPQGTYAEVYVGGDKVATLDITNEVEQATSYNGVIVMYGKGKISVVECGQGRMCRHDGYAVGCKGESIVCPLSQVVVEVK